MSDIKYPYITVRLTGINGNAFVVLGYVTQALKKAEVPKLEIDKFKEEAMSGDYDHLLVTCMKWVHVK